MVSIKALAAFCFSIMLIISLCDSCQKEIGFPPGSNDSSTVQTAPVPAVYSLISAFTYCSNTKISGIYQQNLLLTDSNTVTVDVMVSGKGSWNISTGSVNGVSFEGNGTFAQTGLQTVTLKGRGTPVHAGDSTFPLKAGNSVCSFTISFKPAGTTTNPSANPDYYYKATIGGIFYQETVTATNGFEVWTGENGVDDAVFGSAISPIPGNSVPNSTSLSIDKGIMRHASSASDDQFRAFFTPGVYPYSAGAGTNPSATGSGVDVNWYDLSGIEWTTHYGASDQSGSTFNIISAEDIRDTAGKLLLKVKIQFACKLYNIQTGEMRTLTNGEFVSIFGPRN